MKENKYDDEIFFQKYSEMPRSIVGLGAAGEQGDGHHQRQQQRYPFFSIHCRFPPDNFIYFLKFPVYFRLIADHISG